MKHTVKGFSLIETLIALTITAVIAGVSIPSFSSSIQRKEVVSTTTLLEASLRTARGHAIAHQTITQVCPLASAAGEECKKSKPANADWSLGWIVFEDTDADNELSNKDQIVSIFRNDSNSQVVFNQRGRLRFFSDGGARSAGFYICNSKGDELRHMQLLHSGRVRIKDSMSKRRQDICTSVSS